MSRTDLYRAFDRDGGLLYIGISKAVFQRIRQHKTYSAWFDQGFSITIHTYETREEAMAAEETAIKEESPKFNVTHSKRRKKRMGENKKHTGMSISITKEERGLINKAEKITGLGRKALIMSLIREKMNSLKNG